jgi:hypothetical protein
MIETIKIEGLLRDLANLYPQDDVLVRKIQSKWPGLVPEISKLSLPSVASVNATSLPEANKQLSNLGHLTRYLWSGLSLPEAGSGAAQTVQRVLFPPDGPQRAGIDWRHRSITYTPQTTVERLLYFLLQNGDRARRCANIECTRPFFIAEQPNERYCSDACAQNVQRLAKAAWWKESGKKWRKARKSSRRKR